MLVSLERVGLTGTCWSHWNVLVPLERVGYWTVLDYLDWTTPLENNVRSFHRVLKNLFYSDNLYIETEIYYIMFALICGIKYLDKKH